MRRCKADWRCHSPRKPLPARLLIGADALEVGRRVLAQIDPGERRLSVCARARRALWAAMRPGEQMVDSD